MALGTSIVQAGKPETLALKGNCGHQAPSCEQAAIADRITRFLK